jgi:hypothetical protein
MPQSVGYGEAEILRVGIRPGELPTERLAAPEFRSSLWPSLGPVWVKAVRQAGRGSIAAISANSCRGPLLGYEVV